MTDSEIKKALEDLVKCNNNEIDCGSCSLSVFYPRCPEEICELSLDLINRLQAENSNLTSDLTSLQNDLTSAKAEIERLKNAYKQVAWERDIFAEDMKQEIKKDCSYLMLDIKTIKAEAYKECIEKVKNYIKAHCNPYGKPDFDYDTSIKILNFIDNLVKEMEGNNND